METRFPAIICIFLLAAATYAQVPSAQEPAPTTGDTVLTTTVRRVVLDVVVTDSKGAPAPGLTMKDFVVTEDGKPQNLLSFDANGFSPDMDYVPPTLPPQPPNTFINMPAAPEKGPLYVLLYDLVNMDSPDQMDSTEDHRTQLTARLQLVKFIQSKPEGTRFAIFVRSDGLHLIQGFTSDKSLLYSAIDPHSPRPHIPTVFLMAPNFGQGDRISALNTLNWLATFLDGLPGRKNLIWFSSQFPVSLFAADTEGPSYRDESKATLDLLAHDQIAVYPVDARGVPSGDSHAQVASSIHSDTVKSSIEPGATSGSASSGPVGTSPSQNNTFVQGSSAVMDSYSAMDEIARDTGGKAFYGNNNLADELLAATESGGVYYTLTYAPTNHNYNNQLRNIDVELEKKGYKLAYRRFYYATEALEKNVSATPVVAAKPHKPEAAHPVVMDTLSANMQYGAPIAHNLIFVVQAQRVGAPAEGTPEQMAELATEPAYFKTRRRSTAPKPLPPIPLQKYVFNFEIPTRQFNQEPSLDLELAAAAFDADGHMMNSVVRIARKDLEARSRTPGAALFFRVEQELEIPLSATTVRFATRDTTNDRLGTMEIHLPLAPETAAH